MAAAGSLKDIYIEEMRDLWSANDQMQRVIQSLSDKASTAQGAAGGIGERGWPAYGDLETDP